ncbi:hypothetical protein HDE_07413 [Halotydeus destructor]|nr:hypothetical protein HDE_07413 [Halotydeus destructor]
MTSQGCHYLTMGLIFNTWYRIVNSCLSMVFGTKYKAHLEKWSEILTVIQKVSKANLSLEDRLDEALARLATSDAMVRNLAEVVAQLEDKVHHQAKEIEELKARALQPPVPLPRSAVPIPPPPPPMPMIAVVGPNNADTTDTKKRKKAKTQNNQAKTPLEGEKTSQQLRPSSSELRSRRGQLRPVRSQGGTPVGSKKQGKKGSRANEDVPDLINKALKEKFSQNFRPPFLPGSPNNIIGEEQEFSFTT